MKAAPIWIVLFLVTSSLLLVGEDKGTCPPQPPAPAFNDAKKAAQHQVKQPGTGFVMLMAVISDTGHVCHANVIQGLDKKTNDEAVKTILTWRFHPAMKGGRSVPVVVNIRLNYRLDKDGNVVLSRPEGAQPGRSGNQ